MCSNSRRSPRSRVFDRDERGSTRTIVPPSTRRGPSGIRWNSSVSTSARYRSYPPKSSSPASPVSATVTERRVSRATYHVGRAELSANGSSNCQASAGSVSHAFGSTMNVWCSVPRCRAASSA